MCCNNSDISKLEKYSINFGNTVYSEFRKKKYGIKSCSLNRKYWLDEIRYQLLQYKKNDDADALCSVNITANLVPSLSIIHDPMNKCNVQVKFTNGNATANIIEINSGGCITNLNVDPVVNIGTSFKYTQDCATPSSQWTINHNLGLVPNIWVEDCSGVDLDAAVEVVDNNTIKLNFSQPVSGKAFLS